MGVKQTEALKLALEALEHMYSAAHDVAEPAITAIREVLVQPEYNATSDHRLMENAQGCMRCNTPKKCALYGCSPLTWPAEQPAVPERKPLTDEEIKRRKPISADFVSFRAGVRCMEREYRIGEKR